jgi:hypothetical protein
MKVRWCMWTTLWGAQLTLLLIGVGGVDHFHWRWEIKGWKYGCCCLTNWTLVFFFFFFPCVRGFCFFFFCLIFTRSFVWLDFERVSPFNLFICQSLEIVWVSPTWNCMTLKESLLSIFLSVSYLYCLEFSAKQEKLN